MPNVCTKSHKLLLLGIIVDMVLIVNVVDWRNVQLLDHADTP